MKYVQVLNADYIMEQYLFLEIFIVNIFPNIKIVFRDDLLAPSPVSLCPSPASSEGGTYTMVIYRKLAQVLGVARPVEFFLIEFFKNKPDLQKKNFEFEKKILG